MNVCFRQAAALVIATALLSGCGGSGSPSMASASDIAVGAPAAGPTPFIGFLPLKGQSLQDVASIEFSIVPKQGAVSAPVKVSYSAAALRSRGYADAGSDEARLPVFGLYAGRSNRVDLELVFTDRSRQRLDAQVVTPAYVDPSGIYAAPVMLKSRAPNAAIGFSYFFVKTATEGILVFDTDGEIRWVSPVRSSAQTSLFKDDRFVVADTASLSLQLVGLDGRVESKPVSATGYTGFHHNLDPGKSGGVLAEVDTTDGTTINLESVLAEIDLQGTVLREWNFETLLQQYMSSQGDDPASFVRAGSDWFHMNAARYDARDDSVVVSSRENFVIKVDYETGRIRWILGDPTKFWYSFPSLRAKALALQGEGTYPAGQHAVSIDSEGNLLLFDNGQFSFNQPAGAPVGQARNYSAVAAYAIDEQTMTAKEVWRFDYGQTIYSDICSSVYEASAGGYLISYATAVERSRARLVGLDRSRAVVFDMELASPAICGTSWSAEPLQLDALSITSVR